MKDRNTLNEPRDINNYKVYRKKVSSLIDSAKRAVYEKKIVEGQNDSSTIWKKIKVQIRSRSNECWAILTIKQERPFQ